MFTAMQISRLSTLLLLALSIPTTTHAQTAATATVAAADTVSAPALNFGKAARVYTIADIEVTGADNYQADIVRGYAGLKIGDRVEIPGSDITAAAKRLMSQGLFSQAQIKVTKTVGDQVWLEYALREQARIHEVR
jgi:outer membrane protein insertion porin family